MSELLRVVFRLLRIDQNTVDAVCVVFSFFLVDPDVRFLGSYRVRVFRSLSDMKYGGRPVRYWVVLRSTKEANCFTPTLPVSLTPFISLCFFPLSAYGFYRIPISFGSALVWGCVSILPYRRVALGDHGVIYRALGAHVLFWKFLATPRSCQGFRKKFRDMLRNRGSPFPLFCDFWVSQPTALLVEMICVS